MTTFAVTNTSTDNIVAGSKIRASHINQNFSDVTAAINDLGGTGHGIIADGAVTTTKIADDAVTLDKIADAVVVTYSETIASNNTDTTIPTSKAVKAYVDGKFPAYTGQESHTIGTMIIKTGKKAANGNQTITFATPFPTACVSFMITEYATSADTANTNPIIKTTLGTGAKSGVDVYINIYNTGAYWLAIGY